MSKVALLEKRISELERRLDVMTREFCPATTDIEAEVDHLIQTLGADGAAMEINRRNRLRKVI